MPSKIDKTKIKKILLITLSNIGDVIVSFPVMDILKGESLLKNHPLIQQVYVYDKRQPMTKTMALLGQLRRERFDLVIDLRNTAIPFLIGAKYCTFPFLRNDPTVHKIGR